MVCPHNFRKSSPDPRPKREGPVELVVFDMDGVLIDVGSSWHMVHRHFGTQNEVALQDYLDGKIDDHEFIRADVALWTRNGPVHHEVIENVLRVPPLMPGAKEAVDALHEAGIKTAIVSGGLEPMATGVAQALGIDVVYANSLVTDGQGYLTGEGILRTPLCDKGEPVRQILTDQRIAAARTAAVGNSCPDVRMFEDVALGIAFNADDECVRHHADVVVEGKDLRAIVPAVQETH